MQGRRCCCFSTTPALEDELPPNRPLDACSRQIPLSPPACLSPAGSGTLSTNPFSCPFPENLGSWARAAAARVAGIIPCSSPGTARRYPSGERRSASRQLEPCHRTNPKLSAAGSSRYGPCCSSDSVPTAQFSSKIGESTEGPAPGDAQTFHCVTRASSAENPPKARGKGRKAKRPAGPVLAAGSGAQHCSRQSRGAEAEPSTSPSPFPLPSPAEPHGWTCTAGSAQLESHSWKCTAGSSGGLQGMGWGQEGLQDPNRAVGPQGEPRDPNRAVGSLGALWYPGRVVGPQ